MKARNSALTRDRIIERVKALDTDSAAIFIALTDPHMLRIKASHPEWGDGPKAFQKAWDAVPLERLRFNYELMLFEKFYRDMECVDIEFFYPSAQLPASAH